MENNDNILQHAYGFDDVSIAPGEITINPELVDISVYFDKIKLGIPFFASSMDAVVDTSFAIKMHKQGGIGVLNLDGLHTRFEDTESIYKEISNSPIEKATSILQKIYTEPIKTDLIYKRVFK